ncbi:sigma-54-dependent Fis family transcriptional regulator [candidate division KSB1 bacterium]|nr:sigma-54-dependent Fis family transcriptional regulator [candidate division KSB1 bacterium]
MTKETDTSLLSQLAQISDRLMRETTLTGLTDLVVRIVQELLRPTDVYFMLFDIRRQTLISEVHRGIPLTRKLQPRLQVTQSVAALLDAGWEILGPDPNRSDRFYLYQDSDVEEHSCIEFRIPLYLDDHHLAVLLLSKKADGTDYTIQEIDLLRTLNNLIALNAERLIRQGKRAAPSGGVFTDGFSLIRRAQYSEILGESEAIHRVIELIDRVAGEDVPVLITGESGTGKELVARAIHRKSRRHDRPLVAMNCAALPENLVESELFGHEKGAFTGAATQKKGRFEYAHLSTLFLDEIGDMSLSSQAKLLRVLQDGSVQRIGGHQTLTVDVRLIAATNKRLMQEIAKGDFREDLFYRINVVQIEMPALRERRQDIELLAHCFFQHYCQIFNKNFSGIDPAAMEWLCHYDFPGNVRELKNLIERAVILETADRITLQSMPSRSTNQIQPLQNPSPKKRLEEIEKEHIEQVLAETGYNKSAAARLLGIARKTLREKIERYGISSADDRR